MGKTLQFRCPLCKRLLIKWEIGSSNCIYKVVELDKNGKTKCTKCNLRLIFDGKGFVADTEKEAAPLNVSRPATQIVEPT